MSVHRGCVCLSVRLDGYWCCLMGRDGTWSLEGAVAVRSWVGHERWLSVSAACETGLDARVCTCWRV